MEAAVEQLERAMLDFAMVRYEGRVEVVAKALGLSRKGLYLKRQRYGRKQKRVECVELA
jgi:DNA-binding NtrC family response regulator